VSKKTRVVVAIKSEGLQTKLLYL